MPLNRIEFQFCQICQIAEINTNIQSIHIWYWEWFIQISNNQFGKVLLEFWAVIRILMSSQICLANLHSLSAWLASSSDWRNMVNIQASSTQVLCSKDLLVIAKSQEVLDSWRCYARQNQIPITAMMHCQRRFFLSS